MLKEKPFDFSQKIGIWHYLTLMQLFGYFRLEFEKNYCQF